VDDGSEMNLHKLVVILIAAAIVALLALWIYRRSATRPTGRGTWIAVGSAFGIAGLLFFGRAGCSIPRARTTRVLP
jgi:hypothetical protein